MSIAKDTNQIQFIIREIDRLIAEMADLRLQVTALSETPSHKRTSYSIRQRDYFGMWNDRKDMEGKSSREWLEDARTQQWVRS